MSELEAPHELHAGEANQPPGCPRLVGLAMAVNEIARELINRAR